MTDRTIRRTTPAIEMPAIAPDESMFPSLSSGELLEVGFKLVLVSGFCELPPLFEAGGVLLGLGITVTS